MPIPALTKTGYLPAGVHLCDFTEIGISFAHNEHRLNLLHKLRDFMTFLEEKGLCLPYYVDGSYSTDKPFPRDIDLVLDCSAATGEQMRTAFALMRSRDEIKTDFDVDYWVYFPDAPSDLRAFFQYVRVDELQAKRMSSGTRKGILRVNR